jgi:lipopolysaccharide transport system ATP-binding protein
MSVAIQIENLSKLYRLGNVGTGTLSRDLQRWFITNVLKKEDPYLAIGAENDHKSKIKSEFVYSLRNINLEIQQGSSLAIIGRNGAGKSTLLKIISRITSPTSGSVKIKGRIASLLEVGTGFHPDLSGRENIFINGSILGMRKHEIQKSLDEIIEFSGVENYIDTPVKRYSSGMYVRLAFSVAAHLNSEILIVDEVLAVGDFEFQKKCLEKMNQIQKLDGRTVIFVSHNITALKALCSDGILIENGVISCQGNIDNVINNYLKEDKFETNYKKLQVESNGFRILSIGVRNEQKEFSEPIERTKAIFLEIEYENMTGLEDIYFTIKFKSASGIYFLLTHNNTILTRDVIKKGKGKAQMVFPRNYFNDGNYTFDLWVQHKLNVLRNLVDLESPVFFEILPEKRDLGAWMGKEEGFIRQVFEWNQID